jgi:hypothetical protein
MHNLCETETKMKLSFWTLTASLTTVSFAIATAHAATPAALIHDEGVGPIAFAARDLQQALTANGYAVTVLPPGDLAAAKPAIRIVLTTADARLPGQPATPGLKREGYAIERVASGSATHWWVIGMDAAGAMYGGLELAEAVRLADGMDGVSSRRANPYLEQRGIKFNIPLDARTPSYSDDSDSSRTLYEGWAAASRIFPLITRFYWGEYDFQWYPEACWSREGFETVQKFIKPRWDPMKATEDGDRPLLMSVKEFVDGVPPAGRLTPQQVADQLQQFADLGLASIQQLDAGTDKELRLTLGDIKAMSLLGHYYAEKIRGAVALCRYQSGGDAAEHAKARAHLVAASNHWKDYAAQWSKQYVKQILTRMDQSPVDIAGIQALVDADIPPELAAPKY